MTPEPTEMRVHGQCPCCGAEDAQLYTCLACDWSTARDRIQGKQRLERFHGGAGRHVYNLYGCFVCDLCWRQMRRSPRSCPLKLFYDLGARKQPLVAMTHPPTSDALSLQWEDWLTERGWSEVTEAYWHRLIEFLTREERERF